MQDRKEETAGEEPDGWAARVVALGRQGLGRAEIAAALDVGIAELSAWEREDVQLAAALARAADLERAWWEAQPREALAAGARLNASTWLGAMRWRFGEAPAGPARGAAHEAPARQEAVFYLPLHRRRRRRDGRPISAEEQRALEIAHVQTFIDDGEAELRRAQAEVARAEAWLARLREDLAATTTRDYGDDAADEEDGEDEDWNADEDEDCDGDDDDDCNGDDDDADDDDADERDGDERDGDGRGDHGGDEPFTAGGESGPDRGMGGGDGAGCAWPVLAGGAGAEARVAQPDLGAGDAHDPAPLRGAPG